jgi:hypothetical protein
MWLLLSGCGQESTSSEPASESNKLIEYEPTPFGPVEVGDHLVGPTVYTVDARAKDLWMYFDFSQGSVVGVQDLKTDNWDLALQRHVIRTNGGDTNPAGQAGILAIEAQTLADVNQVPSDTALVSDVRTKKRLHAYNPELHKWYHYSYTNNVLSPKPIVYVVRTQDGKYAKMRILSYYCKNDVAGCMTFEYVYQGDGSTNLEAPATKVSRQFNSR